MISSLELDILPEAFAICRLPAESPVPEWARGLIVSITRSSEELSIVCEEKNVPREVRAERGRRGLRVKGTIPLAQTGVLASLAAPLAKAEISIFAVSTYDTDYLFVAAEDLPDAAGVLEAAGHIIRGSAKR